MLQLPAAGTHLPRHLINLTPLCENTDLQFSCGRYLHGICLHICPRGMNAWLWVPSWHCPLTSAAATAANNFTSFHSFLPLTYYYTIFFIFSQKWILVSTSFLTWQLVEVPRWTVEGCRWKCKTSWAQTSSWLGANISAGVWQRSAGRLRAQCGW